MKQQQLIENSEMIMYKIYIYIYDKLYIAHLKTQLQGVLQVYNEKANNRKQIFEDHKATEIKRCFRLDKNYLKIKHYTVE